MPSRLTPLDVKAFANHETYRKGEQIFENDLVKHRFQTLFGLQATVRSDGVFRVEMIVDKEQLFGRCNCAIGSSPCEHKVATLLAWLHEPATFISYQALRKAIRAKDKDALIDILLNLTEVFPELSRFFISVPGKSENEIIREDVAEIFDMPHRHKIMPLQIIEPCQILFVRAKLLRNESRWDLARTIYFEILNRILALLDRQQIEGDFRENFIAELADDYEEIALSDPNFTGQQDGIHKEVIEILSHDCAEVEGVFLDDLKLKLDIDAEKAKHGRLT